MAILRQAGRHRLAKDHWFFTAAERDRVLDDMSRKHDTPASAMLPRWFSRSGETRPKAAVL